MDRLGPLPETLSTVIVNRHVSLTSIVLQGAPVILQGVKIRPPFGGCWNRAEGDSCAEIVIQRRF